jgi:transposase
MSMSKSEQIRNMYLEGRNINEIAKELNSNYSFVYTVVKKLCDKNGLELRHTVTDSKSDKIRSMWDNGMTVGQISKELNTNYSYVWTVVEKYRKEQEQNKK